MDKDLGEKRPLDFVMAMAASRAPRQFPLNCSPRTFPSFNPGQYIQILLWGKLSEGYITDMGGNWVGNCPCWDWGTNCAREVVQGGIIWSRAAICSQNWGGGEHEPIFK